MGVDLYELYEFHVGVNGQVCGHSGRRPKCRGVWNRQVDDG